MAGLYLIGVLIGLFMICVGLFNWESWFFDPESRLIEVIGGENAVRWYWAICGLCVIVWSVVSWYRAS